MQSHRLTLYPIVPEIGVGFKQPSGTPNGLVGGLPAVRLLNSDPDNKSAGEDLDEDAPL